MAVSPTGKIVTRAVNSLQNAAGVISVPCFQHLNPLSQNLTLAPEISQIEP